VARERLFERSSNFTLADPRSLLRWAQWLKGRSLRDSLNDLQPSSRQIALEAAERFAKAEIRADGSFKGPKGILGVLTEIIHFGLAPDNIAAADLKEAGLELKVTGLLKNSKGVRAKERLSLGMIDYRKCTERGRTFEEDIEIQKSLSGLLLMTYWYKAREANPLDLVFHDSIIWKPVGQERHLIKKDWAFIQACVQSGHAHMLSERYAYALGAPPKGAGKDTDFQAQPVRQPIDYQQTAKHFVSMGVEEEQATYAAKDFKERSKRPGNSVKGYVLPKDRALATQLGPFPARRRCYSLTNSYLTKLIRENMTKD
jgi:DNA mismatch repair protein MutH